MIEKLEELGADEVERAFCTHKSRAFRYLGQNVYLKCNTCDYVVFLRRAEELGEAEGTLCKHDLAGIHSKDTEDPGF